MSKGTEDRGERWAERAQVSAGSLPGNEAAAGVAAAMLASSSGDAPWQRPAARDIGDSAAESWSSPLPSPLGERYEDIRLLGEGGMGTVYRARDRRLGRVVALKLLRKVDPELARRLLQEARAQARVQHDLVCRVYEAGEAGGEPFIVMQYIDGE